MAGRGFGKTRIGAEEAWWYAQTNPGHRLAIVAPTQDDLRKVCLEGESGLLACCPPEVLLGGSIDDAYNSTSAVVRFANGSLITGYSAEKPNRLRGPQHHWAWCDELAGWEPLRMQETWDMLQFGLRLGDCPRALVTTTPKPYPLIYGLVKDARARVVSGSTYENLDNLAPTFRRKILAYEGTELGRQEIYAELVDLDSRAILKAGWWRLWPDIDPEGRAIYPDPVLAFASVDGAYTEKEENDATAVTVWYVFVDTYGRARVLLRYAWEDRLEFPDLIDRLKRTVRHFGLKRLVIEAKANGLSIIQELRRHQPDLIIHPWVPRGDKVARAHSVTPLLAQGLVSGAARIREGEVDPEFIGAVQQAIDACKVFPFAEHDDMADSVVQGLDFIQRQGFELFDVDAPPPPPIGAQGKAVL
jgi:hypothetical protein